MILPHRWHCKDFFIEISSPIDKLISIAFFHGWELFLWKCCTLKSEDIEHTTNWIEPWWRKWRRRIKKANWQNCLAIARISTHELYLQSQGFIYLTTAPCPCQDKPGFERYLLQHRCRNVLLIIRVCVAIIVSKINEMKNVRRGSAHIKQVQLPKQSKKALIEAFRVFALRITFL